ncbi:MAG: prolyl oligopeptidase family serine peptidase [Candidatus Omnitrophica bacterium]|nr:prolyl oligopeptidase family serine peptidase [Candidatus Omnitrophota bacterium]
MHIGRTRFKNQIVTEFIPPSNKKSRKVMIFCAGVPSAPFKDDVLEFWAKKGHWTFFPRYRGTWESSGGFLSRSLEKDVLDVIDSVSLPFKDYWNGKTYKVEPSSVTVVGSSFGGPAAILSTLDERVNKAICISPVVDWKAENKAEPLSHLYQFLQLAYPGAYRINKTAWNKLARGTYYNPVRHQEKIDGRKVMIFHAKNDDVVKFKPVAKFAKEVDCTFIGLNKGGHLSSSMLMKNKYYRKVKEFLGK